MAKYDVIVIVGPTACGKTRRGVQLARAIGGEIISADSRQIYRGMNIGTGKDLEEYDGIPYHLIDIKDAGYKYNLFEYVRDARQAINDIKASGKIPVIVGGTGLYVETLLKGLNLPEVPENKTLRQDLSDKTLEELSSILAKMKTLHNKTDIDTKKRAIRAIEIALYYQEKPELAPTLTNSVPYNALILNIEIPRDDRRSLITKRLHQRLNEGMVEEVKTLLDSGLTPDDLIYYGLEYKFITLYLTGEKTYEEMTNELEIAIHQFAKRQATWFRGMKKRGFTLHDIPYNLTEEQFNKIVLSLFE